MKWASTRRPCKKLPPEAQHFELTVLIDDILITTS